MGSNGTLPFGEIAMQISKRVEPSTTDAEVYYGLEHLDPENLRIKRWGSPAEVKGQKLAVKEGQIIFGKRRAYQRKLAVAPADGICSAHAMVLEANPEAILPDLLPFFMQSDRFMERAVAISEGSLSPTIKWKTLAAQKFPLPPKKRQEEILEVLQALEDSLRATEDAIESAEQLKRSLVAKLFSIMPEDYVTKMPKGATTLGTHASFITSGSRGWAKYYSDAGALFIRITNLKRNSITLDLADQRFVIPPDSAEAKRTRVRPGDLLISVTADIGIVCVVDHSCDEAYVNQHIALVRLRSSVNPRFAAHWLASVHGQRQFLALNDSGAKAGLNLTSIKGIRIPNLPRDEQDQFVDVLDRALLTIAQINKKKQTLSRVKSTVLSKILT